MSDPTQALAILDPRFRPRTANEWTVVLRWAVAELEKVIQAPARITSFTVSDDRPDAATEDNGVDVVFETTATLGFDLCGCVGCLVKIGERVWMDAVLLAFAGGRRVPGKLDQVLEYRLDLGPAPTWTALGWGPDEHGEWMAYEADDRWRDGDSPRA